jgi:hypothetical protein
MTQEGIDARRRQLAEEYLALDDGLSERGLQIAHEFGVLSEQERRLLQSGSKPPPGNRTSRRQREDPHG